MVRSGNGCLSGRIDVRIGIVGGGVSGLAAARAASDRGADAVVFDKGRGFGGRLSTRRVKLQHGETLFFDHGCPSFSATRSRDGDPGSFRATVERAVRDGAASWVEPEQAIGLPHMNAFVAWLGAGLDVRFGVRVAGIAESRGRLSLQSETREGLGDFDRVILTAPAPQAATLLAAVDADAAARLSGVDYEPRWVAMLATKSAVRNSLELPGDGDVLERLTSRDGRAWTARATATWSEQNLEADPERVLRTLAEAARVAHPAFNATLHASAHRWRYAQARRSFDTLNMTGAGGRVLVCGDGFGGSGVRAAWIGGARTGTDATR
jgi:predicted NAD/FAD-dependent oxidoreductase